jgi:ubiquinone/menaquinone biosynthesis C-methylase UbiE
LSVHARRALGVDVATDAVAAAKAMHASATCSFIVYDGTRLPFENSRFDVVTSFQTIEHVVDDVGFIAEAARVVRRDAQFVLTTPNRATRLRAGQRPWNRFHVREYSARELEVLLSKSFSRVEVFGVRASERIEQVERARVAAAQRLEALDLLGSGG